MTVGLRVELEGQTEKDQIDETFMWVDGSFGRILIGEDDGAMGAMGIYPPSVGGGLYGPLYASKNHVEGGALVGEGAWGLSFDGDSNKIAWYSPPGFLGTRIGVSYTPDNGETGEANPTNNDGEQSQVVGIGGNWKGALGDANVSVGGGYTVGQLEDGAEGIDRQEWVVGASVSMSGELSGLTVAGNYSMDNNGMDNHDRTTVAVGVSYPVERWTLGITYGLTERENGDDPDHSNSVVQLGLQTPLGAGVTWNGAVQFWDIDAGSTQNDATVALTGIQVSF